MLVSDNECYFSQTTNKFPGLLQFPEFPVQWECCRGWPKITEKEIADKILHLNKEEAMVGGKCKRLTIGHKT